MIPQYSHDLVTSVVLWLDNKICNDGQAYDNIGSVFYRQSNLSNIGYVWASPYKTFVFDDCVSGANIISGAYTTSGQFLTRASGITIDYINGRIISQYDWGSVLSGDFASKEMNVYYSTKQQINYWLENMMGVDPDMTYANTGAPAFRFAAPCAIVTLSKDNNKGFALGGLRDSKSTIRLFIITDNNYLQEGILSLLADKAQKYIPLGTYADAPLNGYGDLKGANYNYCTGIYGKYGCANGAYIENVYSMKINELANKNNTYLVSAVELDLSVIRVPKA